MPRGEGTPQPPRMGSVAPLVKQFEAMPPLRRALFSPTTRSGGIVWNEYLFCFNLSYVMCMYQVRYVSINNEPQYFV